MNTLTQSSSHYSSRFQELDVLRGLAALLVVFSHYIPYWDRYFNEIWVLVPNLWGFNAVKFFFVISGFVIFFTLDKCKTVFDFSASRFGRLYPAYIATLILVSVISIIFFDKNFWLGGFLANSTMFQEFLGYPHFDNVYWSLSVELAFYLNVAVLLTLKLHRNIIPIVFFWLISSCLWHELIYDSALKNRDWLALFFALDYAPYFAIGMLFFDAAKKGWNIKRISLLILCVSTEYILSSWDGVLIALGSIITVFLAMNGQLRFSINKVTLWLGTISYSLYLVHRNLGYASLTALHDAGIDHTLAIPLVTLFALVLASLITYKIEQPLAKQIKITYSKMKMKMKERSL